MGAKTFSDLCSTLLQPPVFFVILHGTPPRVLPVFVTHYPEEDAQQEEKKESREKIHGDRQCLAPTRPSSTRIHHQTHVLMIVLDYSGVVIVSTTARLGPLQEGTPTKMILTGADVLEEQCTSIVLRNHRLFETMFRGHIDGEKTIFILLTWMTTQAIDGRVHQLGLGTRTLVVIANGHGLRSKSVDGQVGCM